MWQATSDILVIVEPGTPAGSGLVRAARAQVVSRISSNKALKQKRQSVKLVQY